jgi:hypothetical protein
MKPTIHSQIWLHDYARQLYIGLAAQFPEIGKEYVDALSCTVEAGLLNFIDRWEGNDPTLTAQDIERARELGLLTEAQAREVSQLLKDSKC